MDKYEFLEHTSEMKFIARGKTLEEAFESSVLAFSEYISRGQKITPRKKVSFEVEGADAKSLFFNFLEELIFYFDAEKFVPASAKVKRNGEGLSVVLIGDDAKNYSSFSDVKAATYSEMFVRKSGNVWEVQAVMDV